MASPVQTLLRELYSECKDIDSGKHASYIPELEKVPPHLFGVSLATVDGYAYDLGDARYPFTIQSISKPFVYGLALADHGAEAVMAKVGVAPTGDSFNSIIFDEENRPFNPMVNAGAIATTGLIVGDGFPHRFSRILELFSAYAGTPLSVDESVYHSERSTGHRNRAIAYLELSNGMLSPPVDEHLDIYFRQCSILVTSHDLAMMAATLANNGIHPITKERVASPEVVTSIMSVMASCGMYDYSGDWLYRIGLPAKSGVGGGIIAVLPGQFGIGTFSPLLDTHGNSVRGIRMCSKLSERFRLHLFDIHALSEGTLFRTYTAAVVSSKRQRRHVERQALDTHGHSVVVFELRGDLYFFTLERLTRALTAHTRCHDGNVTHVIVDMQRVGSVDGSASVLFTELRKWLQRRGVRLLIASAPPPLLQLLLHDQAWPPQMFFPHVDRAIEAGEDDVITLHLGTVAHTRISLRDVDILSSFSDEEVLLIEGICDVVTFLPNDHIIQEGELSDRMFFLVDGIATVQLRISKGADGAEFKRLVSYIPGTIFGELSLFDSQPSRRSADIVADTSVVCYSLQWSRLDGLLSQAPLLYVKFVKVVGNSLAHTLKRITTELRSIYMK